MNSSLQGSLAETQAADYLVRKGHKLIARNFRAVGGEIDLVTLENKTLVFVEVKTRKNNDFGTPLEAITKTKYNHIKQGVMMYLNDCKVKYDSYRIDAIGITLEPKTDINHLKNIFI